jgi:hypothetical protein
MHPAICLCRPSRSMSILSLALSFVLLMGCGPEDYQKPIQQFQDSSNVVINTTRAFLNNMNLIEQNDVLDDVVFPAKEARLTWTQQN